MHRIIQVIARYWPLLATKSDSGTLALNLFKPAFIGVLLLLGSLVHADSAGQALSALLSERQGISAEFRQTTYDADGKAVQHQKGSLLVKRPHLFRWQTESPWRQLLVSDGSRLTVYDEDLEQVTIRPLDRAYTSTPALLLSGDISGLETAFEIERVANDHGDQVFRLVPRDAQSLFEEMVLRFAGDKLVAMELRDSLGQSTHLGFLKVSHEPAIPPGAFDFVPPEGADVLIDSDLAAAP